MNEKPGNPGKSKFDAIRVHSFTYQKTLLVVTPLHCIESLTKADLTVNVVLPTGAMGNAVGGYIAKRMGVPLGMICSGVNINDITYRVMKTGKFHKSDTMEKTLSDAINIQLVRHLVVSSRVSDFS